MSDPDLSLIQPVSLYLAENIPVATLDPVDMMVHGLKDNLYASGWYMQSSGWYCHKVGHLLKPRHWDRLEKAITHDDRQHAYEMVMTMDIDTLFNPVKIWTPNMQDETDYLDTQDRGDEFFIDMGTRFYPDDFESYILYLRAEWEATNGI